MITVIMATGIVHFYSRCHVSKKIMNLHKKRDLCGMRTWRTLAEKFAKIAPRVRFRILF